MYSYITREGKPLFKKKREKMNDNNKQKSNGMALGMIAGAAAPIIGGLIGGIGQKKRARKQHERQKELMGIQQQNQLALAEDAHNRQLDMWDKTNYSAQMDQMKKAGLNSALLYGQSGGGGATTGAGNMGQAAGGQAAAPMDIGAAINAAAAASQIKLTNAQAKKTEEEAKEIETDNQVRDRYGKEADLLEASNRIQKALQGGQYLYEYKEGEKPDSNYQKKIHAEIESLNIGNALQQLMQKGQVSDNQVKAYKAKLAEAQIDPDSNPLVRELMKAMADQGVPLNKILQKVVNWFIK